MDTEKLTIEELFNELPNIINIDGTLYHFHLIKGNNRILVMYRTDEDNYLHSTCRGGKTLKLALKGMLDWLIEHELHNVKSENILIDMIKISQKNK